MFSLLGGVLIYLSTLMDSELLKISFKTVGIIGMFYGIAGSNFFIKCPRCSANLSREQMKGQSKRNFCPGCGVSLDEAI